MKTPPTEFTELSLCFTHKFELVYWSGQKLLKHSN